MKTPAQIEVKRVDLMIQIKFFFKVFLSSLEEPVNYLLKIV